MKLSKTLSHWIVPRTPVMIHMNCPGQCLPKCGGSVLYSKYPTCLENGKTFGRHEDSSNVAWSSMNTFWNGEALKGTGCQYWKSLNWFPLLFYSFSFMNSCSTRSPSPVIPSVGIFLFRWLIVNFAYGYGYSTPHFYCTAFRPCSGWRKRNILTVRKI